MKTFNNELEVHRSESFTTTKSLYNKDGSPYIVSSKTNNPYFLITVSNSRYEQDGRYMYRKWLDASKDVNNNPLPRFESTVPLALSDIKDGPDSDTPAYNSLPTTTLDEYVLTGYLDGRLVQIEPNDFVIYTEDEDNVKHYYYATVSGNDITWKEYSCYLIVTFSSEVTAEWVEQTYYYSIQLVTGELNDNTDSTLILKVPFDTCVPILAPTKLKVTSNLEGGLLWMS